MAKKRVTQAKSNKVEWLVSKSESKLLLWTCQIQWLGAAVQVSAAQY
jgi:hypothetical protein